MQIVHRLCCLFKNKNKNKNKGAWYIIYPLLFGNKNLFTWVGPYAWPDFFYVFFIVINPNLGQGLRISHELGGLTKKKNSIFFLIKDQNDIVLCFLKVNEF